MEHGLSGQARGIVTVARQSGAVEKNKGLGSARIDRTDSGKNSLPYSKKIGISDTFLGLLAQVQQEWNFRISVSGYTSGVVEGYTGVEFCTSPNVTSDGNSSTEAGGGLCEYWLLRMSRK
jgi:hypothetical protein